MANEAEIIDNPTSTPAAVSTGYQAQNTNLVSQRNGIDRTIITGSGTTATLEISGPIDVNGVMYSIKSSVAFGLSTPGNYIIYLSGSGDNLTPTLTSTPGTFDALKNAHYTAANYRILNWLIHYDGSALKISKIWQDPSYEELTTSGTWKAMFSKNYEFWCTGAGGDGGDGVYSSHVFASSGGGGGAGGTGITQLYIEAGTVWTATLSTTSGANCTFSDGSTTLTFQNGTDGNGNAPGTGGSTLTGFDFSSNGENGVNGSSVYNTTSMVLSGGKGGRSAHPLSVGGGTMFSGLNGQDGEYGGGGGGAEGANNVSPQGVGGSGGDPVIRIIG